VVVVERGDAVLVKVVADGNDEGGLGVLAGDAHLLGDLFLVRPALASPVADNGEVEPGDRRGIGVERGGHEPSDEGGLGGGEEAADEIAAREGHGR